MVVEKSSTRRPTKLFVKIPSSLSAIVILKTPPACLRPRRDPKLRCHVREAIPGTKCSISRRPSLLASRSTGTNLAWRYHAGLGAFLRVLFVTTEMDDFVRVGGLAAVSAALPRALRSLSDVRIILPGYRDVVEQFLHIEIVGQCPPLADLPACSLGLTATKDGLPVYVLLCPQLSDRPGNPYGDASGRDWPDNDV